MGDDFDYGGVDSILKLIQKPASFAYVFTESYVEQVLMYPRGLRDSDLLQENLGIV